MELGEVAINDKNKWRALTEQIYKDIGFSK